MYWDVSVLTKSTPCNPCVHKKASMYPLWVRPHAECFMWTLVSLPGEDLHRRRKLVLRNRYCPEVILMLSELESKLSSTFFLSPVVWLCSEAGEWKRDRSLMSALAYFAALFPAVSSTHGPPMPQSEQEDMAKSLWVLYRCAKFAIHFKPSFASPFISFPFAALTNYYKLSGLKSCRFILHFYVKSAGYLWC